MKISYSRDIIAAGYLIIAFLIVGIAYIHVYDWKQVSLMNERLNEVHEYRRSVHQAYAEMIDLTMLGETVLEWVEADSAIYRFKRLQLDSLLCTFIHERSDTRIDSVRQLLADKEALLFEISHLLNKQAEYREQLSETVPIIARESTHDTKKGGFMGLFKKKSSKPSNTSVMLESLQRDVLSKQQEQEMMLSRTVDSLAMRSLELNEKLQSFIGALDTKTHLKLQGQEEEYLESRKQSSSRMLFITYIIILLLFISYVIIYRDITHIIRYKKEASELIAQLQKSNQRNVELLTDRKNMMLTVSHDLRAPLTAIFGYVDLLSDEPREEIRKHYSEAIHAASHRMLELVNTLLDYHRLDVGKDQPDNIPFRLRSIIETLAAEYTMQANERGLMLNLDYEGENVPVIGDKGRILQIAGNLLSNALKFTPKGEVSLHIRYKDERFVLTVADSGIGMSEEQIHKMFNPFERFENADPQEGFGLGLSITLALVKLLGGEIQVASHPQIGTKITVELPLSLCSEKILEQQKKAMVRLPHPIRIAVVENDPIVLRMAADILSGSQAKVDAYGHVRELMERIRTTRYDLVITDIMMPDINGYGLLELLRTSNIGNAKSVLVMAMTARAEKKPEEFKKAGFAGCVYKPFSREELLEAVASCVEYHPMGYRKIDFSVLLSGEEDGKEMLGLLIRETEKNMAGLSEAMEHKDKAAVSAYVHHLLSTWELLRIGHPLMELQRILAATDTMDETVEEAVCEVQATARQLVEQADGMIKGMKP